MADVARTKRHHVFAWFFLAVQALFLFWVIAGANSTSTGDCTGLSAQECHDATSTGTALGIGLVIALWIGVDLVLGVIRIIVLLSRRKG
jgi:hypothetical protein